MNTEIRKWIHGEKQSPDQGRIDTVLDDIFKECKKLLDHLVKEDVIDLDKYEDLIDEKYPNGNKEYFYEIINFLEEESIWYYSDLDNHVEGLKGLEESLFEVKLESGYGHLGLGSGLDGMTVALWKVKQKLHCLRAYPSVG